MDNNAEIKKLNLADGKAYPFGKRDNAFISAVTKIVSRTADSKNEERLKSLLCEKAGGSKAVLFSSSLETYVGAIKCARNFANKKGDKERKEILFFNKSFFDRVNNKIFFEDLNLKYVEVNHLGNFIAALNEKTAAVAMEFVDELNNVVFAKEFIKQIVEICSVRDIAFIVDESMNGLGRTGELFSFSTYGVQPDITVITGGLCGDFNLGTIILKEKFADCFDYKRRVGAVVCEGGLSFINSALISLDSVKKKAKTLYSALKICKDVKSYGGIGFMAYADVFDGKTVVSKFKDKGISLKNVNNRILFNLPVNIGDDEFNYLISVIKDVFKGATNPFER